MRVALVLLAACAATATTPSPTPAPATAPLAQVEARRDLDGAVIGRSAAPTVVMWMASWCEHCRAELAVFAQVHALHPDVRWVALNYKGHEEYDNRGNSVAIRELATKTPWMRFVPADDALFNAFDGPPKIPTIYVYSITGKLVATFDRRERPAPDAIELQVVLHAALH